MYIRTSNRQIIRKPWRDRFFNYLNKNKNGCWEWIGCTNSRGYGIFNRDNVPGLSHRFSWEIAYGEIPVGLSVLHKCDNRKCCRPDHLFLGTRADNNYDMVAKGRNIRGNRVKNARLNVEDVLKIRNLKGTKTHKEMGELFGVSKECVWHVINNRNWKWVK